MSLVCFLAGLLASLRTFGLVSGCSYREIECRDPNLDVLQCHRCGRITASWRYSMPAGWRAS